MEVGRDPSMQAKQPKWSIPTAPSPENGTAFDLVGPFCVLGVSSALYVVERPTMKVVSIDIPLQAEASNLTMAVRVAKAIIPNIAAESSLWV